MPQPLTLRRWRRAEYDRLVEPGVFEDDPVELIGGHLVVAEPKGTPPRRRRWRSLSVRSSWPTYRRD
jgi:hypothetical protein